jgi:hypothetical protein
MADDDEIRDNLAELYDKLLMAVKLLEEAVACVAGIEDDLDVRARAKQKKVV